MKVKLVIATTVPETLFTILRGQPRWLSEHFDVVCVTSPGLQNAQVREAEGVEVIEVPMSRGISPVKDLFSIMRMCKVLRDLKPDIVHSYTPKAGLVAMLSAFFLRIPIRVHTFTGLVFPTCSGLKRQLLITVDRLICFSATRVVPEGLGVAYDLSVNKVTGKTLEVIGHGNIAGVDVDYFCPSFSGRLEIGERLGFVFCFVGRLNRDKGIAELVRAFQKVSQPAKLIIVGELDQTAPIDDETISMIRSDSSIITTGFLSDIRPALAICDAVVLPSYREGFPNALLQAGAMAKPAIASDINGCNEIVENGHNGLLVTPGSVESLLFAMNEFLHMDEGELLKLGNSARKMVVERFDQSTYRESLLKFYQERIDEAFH